MYHPKDRVELANKTTSESQLCQLYIYIVWFSLCDTISKCPIFLSMRGWLYSIEILAKPKFALIKSTGVNLVFLILFI